jgi:hypothetical protein
MSTSALGPVNPTGKPWYQRPESITQGLILIGLGGLALWGWGSVSHFIEQMLVDTVHIVGLAILLVAIGWVLTSSRTHLIFRLISRKLTSIVYELDPIGVLKDNLLQMRKLREVFGQQIASVSGANQILRDNIAKNKAEAERGMRDALEAKRRLDAAKTQDEQLRMQLQIRKSANMAGRRNQTNVGYEDLLKKSSALYDFLNRLSVNLDFTIEDTADTVKQEEIKRKTINMAYGAFSTAMKIISGNADQRDLINEDLEYLAQQNSMKLGVMENYQKAAQNFMDSMDIENGAVGTAAMAELEKYEQKLLTAGTPEAQVLGKPIPQKATASVPVSSDYGDYFNQK